MHTHMQYTHARTRAHARKYTYPWTQWYHQTHVSTRVPAAHACRDSAIMWERTLGLCCAVARRWRLSSACATRLCPSGPRSALKPLSPFPLSRLPFSPLPLMGGANARRLQPSLLTERGALVCFSCTCRYKEMQDLLLRRVQKLPYIRAAPHERPAAHASSGKPTGLSATRLDVSGTGGATRSRPPTSTCNLRSRDLFKHASSAERHICMLSRRIG